MTDKDKKFERIAQRHIADLKKSSRSMVEDAAVRAVHKVMTEFAQGAHTEAKVEYHTTMIQCPHCDEPVRVPAQSYPDNFIDALKYDVAKRDSEAQPEQEPVAWLHWLHGPVRLFLNKDEAMMELDRLNREYPVDKNARQMKPLYTTPPQRRPLTDEEIDKIPWEPHEGNPMTFAEGLRYFARAIEAKLREKNV